MNKIHLPLLALLMLLPASLMGQASWKLYTTANSEIVGNTILALTCDSKNALWVGTNSGLCKLSGKTWTDCSLFNKKLKDQAINCLCFDKKDILWVGTDDFGILEFDGTHWADHELETRRLGVRFVGDIAVDQDNDKWIGVTLVGMVHHNDELWKLFTPADSGLPSDFILNTAVDAANNIWIGTNNGLALFNRKRWVVFNPQNSKLPDKIVPAVVIDNDNIKWIGTTQGLCRFDGEQWTIYNTKNSPLADDQINALALDAKGLLWIATRKGITVTDRNGQWDNPKPSGKPLPQGSIITLLADQKDNIWIGYDLHGLVCLSGYQFPVLAENKPAEPEKKESPLVNSVRVNPFLEQGYVTLSIQTPTADVSFINEDGDVVKRIARYQNEARIPISKIPKGKYNLKVITTLGTKNIRFNLK